MPLYNPSGGSTPKLDDCLAPDDNTDLDASTAKHGLMQKYPGGTSNFLRSDGTFTAPTATVADQDKPLTGSLTVETGKYHVTGFRHSLTSTQRLTIAGTGRLRIQN